MLGILAAILTGVSKTGVPGVGILIVPMMGAAFPGRVSVGTLLPMLMFADCFAVTWYRKDTRWDKLWGLMPWVMAGMAGGAVLLWALGEAHTRKDLLNIIIGFLVLAMLGVHLARLKWGSKLSLSSGPAVAATGGTAGFSTMVSNAAGPVMGIYLTNLGLPKKEFMGTTAVYFFLLNLTKFPVYLLLTSLRPDKPLVTVASLKFDLTICPMILVGVVLGRWLLPRITQKRFDGLVLSLAAIAALYMIWTGFHMK